MNSTNTPAPKAPARKAYPFRVTATRLRDNRWAVAPEGQLGTMGWFPAPWEIAIVTAPTAWGACMKAIAKTERYSASTPGVQIPTMVAI